MWLWSYHWSCQIERWCMLSINYLDLGVLGIDIWYIDRETMVRMWRSSFTMWMDSQTTLTWRCYTGTHKMSSHTKSFYRGTWREINRTLSLNWLIQVSLWLEFMYFFKIYKWRACHNHEMNAAIQSVVLFLPTKEYLMKMSTLMWLWSMERTLLMRRIWCVVTQSPTIPISRQRSLFFHSSCFLGKSHQISMFWRSFLQLKEILMSTGI